MKSRVYKLKPCEKRGCNKEFRPMTGNQKYCDEHKQSHAKRPSIDDHRQRVAIETCFRKLQCKDLGDEDRVALLRVAYLFVLDSKK